MDTHIFRLIGEELSPLLHGARVEKIHSPAPGLLSLRFFNHGAKRTLVLRHNKVYNHGLKKVTPLKGGKVEPALYLTNLSLPNPLKPPTLVMTLRKYAGGQRLGSPILDWVKRRIFLPLPPREVNAPPLWLCLDLQDGASITNEVPQTEEAHWPSPSILSELLAEQNAGQSSRMWRSFPVLTPLLRKTLGQLDYYEAASLLADLQDEAELHKGQLFAYGSAGTVSGLSAWPLPDALRQGMDEIIIPASDPPATCSYLEAARELYEPDVLAKLGFDTTKNERQASSSARKRLERTLAKLDEEEKRLNALLAERQKGQILQNILWQYGPEEKRDFIHLSETELPIEGNLPSAIASLQADNGGYIIQLDANLTVRENMQRFFKQSGRGVRGLESLKVRRASLMAELEALDHGLPLLPPSLKTTKGIQKHGSVKGPDSPHKLVQRFTSSDGFMLLRGRSAAGNQALLKLARPHDLWLHVQDGPSAHVIIRRGSLAENIPERTLREAGNLSGLKSWRKHDDRAEIMFALVKDVRPVKGGAPGSVLVDKTLGSFVVMLAPELEQKLQESTGANTSGTA